MSALNKETLQLLVKAYQGDDLAGYLHEQLELAEWILHRIRELNDDQDSEDARHKLGNAEIQKGFKEVRDKCLHWQTTYYPDPSGNNDSSITCDLCGRDLNRAERNKWIPQNQQK